MTHNYIMAAVSSNMNSVNASRAVGITKQSIYSDNNVTIFIVAIEQNLRAYGQ